MRVGHHRLRPVHQHLSLPGLRHSHLSVERRGVHRLRDLHRQLQELHRQRDLHRLPGWLRAGRSLHLFPLQHPDGGVPAVHRCCYLHRLLLRLLPVRKHLSALLQGSRKLRDLLVGDGVFAVQFRFVLICGQYHVYLQHWTGKSFGAVRVCRLRICL